MATVGFSGGMNFVRSGSLSAGGMNEDVVGELDGAAALEREPRRRCMKGFERVGLVVTAEPISLVGCRGSRLSSGGSGPMAESWRSAPSMPVCELSAW